MYFDHIIVGVNSERELSEHGAKYKAVMKSRNMNLNNEKTVYGVPSLPILSYLVGRGEIKLDPGRLEALQQLSPCNSNKSLKAHWAFFLLCQVDS